MPGCIKLWKFLKFGGTPRRHGLEIYQLQANGYVKPEASMALLERTATRLNEFLALRQTQGENQVIRSVRDWIRQDSR